VLSPASQYINTQIAILAICTYPRPQPGTSTPHYIFTQMPRCHMPAQHCYQMPTSLLVPSGRLPGLRVARHDRCGSSRQPNAIECFLTAHCRAGRDTDQCDLARGHVTLERSSKVNYPTRPTTTEDKTSHAQQQRTAISATHTLHGKFVPDRMTRDPLTGHCACANSRPARATSQVEVRFGYFFIAQR